MRGDSLRRAAPLRGALPDPGPENLTGHAGFGLQFRPFTVSISSVSFSYFLSIAPLPAISYVIASLPRANVFRCQIRQTDALKIIRYTRQNAPMSLALYQRRRVAGSKLPAPRAGGPPRRPRRRLARARPRRRARRSRGRAASSRARPPAALGAANRRRSPSTRPAAMLGPMDSALLSRFDRPASGRECLRLAFF